MQPFSNRVTTLLGINYPIIQAGMIWTSGWRLAAAVSNSGGLGVIGAGSMTPALLREHIQKMQIRHQQTICSKSSFTLFWYSTTN